jgi:hypothetical protein
MNEEDRVFARFKSNKREASGRRERLTIPRRAGASGNRIVEVVHVRSTTTMKDQQRDVGTRVRSASWDSGFLAKQTAPGAMPIEPMAPESPKPVRHIMTAEETAAVEIGTAPLPSAEAPFATVHKVRGSPLYETASKPARRFANPFDAGDDGANCMRRGYAIAPEREKRGLMTCSECG